MGVIFGALFIRWRRTNPMIIAHALINAVAFIGYTLPAGHVSWLPRTSRAGPAVIRAVTRDFIRSG
jgi:hypothetical protein